MRRLAITRLGEGVDESGELLPAPIARVHAVLDGYAREAAALGVERVLAVATSAVRDASNGGAFLNGLGTRYGWETRLLDGGEEAETTFRGVTSDRSLAAETLMVDIGGGSTELLVGGPDGVSFATSLQAGCVRLTERFLESDPTDGTRARSRPARTFAPSSPPSTSRRRSASRGRSRPSPRSTSGSTDVRPRSDPRPPDPARCSRPRASRALRAPLAERERVPGLEPARAPVIVGGLVVLREVMARYGLDEIEASERDILHGAALAAAADAALASPS